jgi:peptidyl-tRNA hydrolase
MSIPQPFEHNTQADCTHRSGSATTYSSTRTGQSAAAGKGVRSPQTSCVRSVLTDRKAIFRGSVTVNGNDVLQVAPLTYVNDSRSACCGVARDRGGRRAAGALRLRFRGGAEGHIPLAEVSVFL